MCQQPCCVTHLAQAGVFCRCLLLHAAIPFGVALHRLCRLSVDALRWHTCVSAESLHVHAHVCGICVLALRVDAVDKCGCAQPSPGSHAASRRAVIGGFVFDQHMCPARALEGLQHAPSNSVLVLPVVFAPAHGVTVFAPARGVCLTLASESLTLCCAACRMGWPSSFGQAASTHRDVCVSLWSVLACMPGTPKIVLHAAWNGDISLSCMHMCTPLTYCVTVCVCSRRSAWAAAQPTLHLSLQHITRPHTSTYWHTLPTCRKLVMVLDKVALHGAVPSPTVRHRSMSQSKSHWAATSV